MPVPSKRWRVAPRLPAEADRTLHGYPPILRQILYNRGYATVDEARRFLNAHPPEGIDPFNLLGMGTAVDRISHAVRAGESIAIYGDYDVDGVTATSLLVQALQSIGAQVRGYIPNRFEEGYGLNNEALAQLSQEGVRLLISVDCGIRSLPEAAYARSLGLDMIITDHHHPAGELPEAVAIINPKQPQDTYPDKDLAGVGLAYKLACALFSCLPPNGNDTPFQGPEDFLDLVALGTVADLAPLQGENRALVRTGIERIRRPIRQGIQALIGVSGLTSNKVTSGDIGFVLGPRLNAAGRLESALDAFKLLTTQNVQEAGILAQQLDVQNRERQQVTRDIYALAEEQALTQDPQAMLLFAAHPDFNSGVVGLAASRLTERYYRPSIVAQQGEEYTRGSCRSIPEFHITDALDRCADLMEHHGGHAAAAGFTIRNERVPELVERLHQIASEQLANQDLRPVCFADAEVPLADLRPDLLQQLGWLQPTGYGNPDAFFVSRDLRVTRSRTVGRDNAHLKLTVTDGRLTFDAIAFRKGEWHEQMPARVDLLYTFELNEFNGKRSLQLNVKELKPAGEPD